MSLNSKVALLILQGVLEKNQLKEEEDMCWVEIFYHSAKPEGGEPSWILETCVCYAESLQNMAKGLCAFWLPFRM